MWAHFPEQRLVIEPSGHLHISLVVGWEGGAAPGHPNLFMKNYIYNTQELGNPYHEQNTLLDNRFLNG